MGGVEYGRGSSPSPRLFPGIDPRAVTPNRSHITPPLHPLGSTPTLAGPRARIQGGHEAVSKNNTADNKQLNRTGFIPPRRTPPCVPAEGHVRPHATPLHTHEDRHGQRQTVTRVGRVWSPWALAAGRGGSGAAAGEPSSSEVKCGRRRPPHRERRQPTSSLRNLRSSMFRISETCRQPYRPSTDDRWKNRGRSTQGRVTRPWEWGEALPLTTTGTDPEHVTPSEGR